MTHFLNKGSMSWTYSGTQQSYTNNFCYSEIPSLQVIMVSIGKGTKYFLLLTFTIVLEVF